MVQSAALVMQPAASKDFEPSKNRFKINPQNRCAATPAAPDCAQMRNNNKIATAN
jgi:hypothetical protein